MHPRCICDAARLSDRICSGPVRDASALSGGKRSKQHNFVLLIAKAARPVPPFLEGDDDDDDRSQIMYIACGSSRYTLSPAEASARIETLGSAGRVRDRNWAVLHRSPLRLEVWGETPGERKHGPLKSASVQELVNEILSRANPAGAQIKVSHGVASPSVAGLKSVMSEPMDHVISYDRFWKELVGLLQDPVKSAGGIKDSSIRTGMGPADEEFAVVEVLHPPPLKVVTEYKVNKAQGWVYSEAFGPDGELQEKGWAVFHGAPLRLECWSETHTVRKFGPARRDPMQYLVNAIMKRVAPAEAPGAVKVSTNAKLRCVVSGDMGKRIDFERLWRELIHVSMHPQRNATMISSEVTRTSDTEFIVVQTLQSGKGKGKGKGGKEGKGDKGAAVTSTATLKYRLNKKRGEVYREAYGQMGKLDEKVWICVRKGPLRLESWAEAPGVRRYGRDKAQQVQTVLDAVLA
ncbi:unnamed protein product [Prorocentrum cordatum]|uniref:Uncharacterized protein n=1 Tax=Prorocentrum cordatum TaxID=2364126 RepID=A0ABN9XJ57_9DINO|nr:unnamed protein product [Polarella glacialis]